MANDPCVRECQARGDSPASVSLVATSSRRAKQPRRFVTGNRLPAQLAPATGRRGSGFGVRRTGAGSRVPSCSYFMGSQVRSNERSASLHNFNLSRKRPE